MRSRRRQYRSSQNSEKAGMKIIGVYDKSAEEYEDEIREISDLYVTRLKDIFF